GGVALSSPGGVALSSPGGVALLAASIGTLPLGTIANLPTSGEPAGTQAAITALQNMPLSDLPIAYPNDCTAGSCESWSQVLAGSDLANAPLQSVSLYDVLTDTSHTDIDNPATGAYETPAQVLDSLDIGNLGMSSSTLGSVPVAAFALGSTPIDDITLPGTTIPAGSSTTQAEQDALSGWCNALASLPDNPYDCASFGITSSDDVSDAASVNLFTLSLAGVALSSPGGVALSSPGGVALSSPGGVELGSSLLSDIALSSPGGVPLADIPVSDLDVSDNPIGSIPLDAITSITDPAEDPLGSVTIGSIALSSPGGVALSSPGGVALSSPGGVGLGAVLLGSIGLGTSDEAQLNALPLQTLESLDFASVPLSELDLASTQLQLGQIPLDDLSLSSNALGSVPLDSLTLASMPSGSIASIALSSPGGVGLANCSLIDCSTADLAQAEAAGAILPGVTLAQLVAAVGATNAEVESTTVGELGNYGGATLADLLSAATAAAQQFVDNTDLGQLGAYGTITLGQLVNAVDTDISSNHYSGGVLSTLQAALDTTLAELGSYGTTTLSELFSEIASGTAFFDCTTADPTVGTDCASVEQILEGDNTSASGWPLLTLDDLLLALEPAQSYPWPTIDLDAVPLAANATNGGVETYTSTINLTGSASGGLVDVSAELPPGFAYVASSATIDGSAAPAPVAQASAASVEWALDLAPGSHTFIFDAAAGIGLGAASASVTAALSGLAGVSGDTSSSTGAAQVTAGLEPDDTLASATPLSTGTLNLGYMTSSTDLNDWSINVAQGQELALALTNLPADYDLELFEPSTAGNEQDLQPGATGESAQVDDSVPSIDPAATVEATPGSSDIPVTAPAGYQLYTVSNDTATDADYADDGGSQHIQTSPLNAGTYIVQVSGYDGATSAQPYLLQAQLLGGTTALTCAAPSFAYDVAGSNPEQSFAPAPASNQPSVSSNVNTLFLVDTQRLQAAFGPGAEAQILQELGELGGDQAAGVDGVTVPVDAYPYVEAAYASWDDAPCSVQAANAVVAA
ncbi:MAG TPA: hypothetical protein VMD59_21900, partial [Acidimicrobiales bacterium]|nr:hypothetical protein [Acidimicrobiales bacterium]